VTLSVSVPVPESTWKARPEGTDYDAVRQRLVDATEELLREGGVGALRQDAVAEGAGLHRSSVYRYFNSKEDLVIAAVVQSTLRIGRRIRERIGETADPENFLVRGIVEALEAMSADPLHRALTTPGSSRAMTRLANTALREGVRPLVEPMFASAAERGVLRDGVSVDDAIRWLQIVALGLMQAPTVVADTDDLEAMLELMLVPSLLDVGSRPRR
jgi:AcrR family transcriptional regulator